MHARPIAALAALILFAAQAAAEITKAPAHKTKQAFRVETYASGLVHPWGLAFLPDGRLIVTERPGRMRLVGKEGEISAPVRSVPAVFARSQGGLLDVALSPDFASSNLHLLRRAT